MKSGTRQWIILALVVISVGEISNAESNATTAQHPSTTPAPAVTTAAERITSPQSTTTVSPDKLCNSKSNTSCSECLDVPGAKCLWCSTNSSCQLYPLSKVLPPSSMCALDKARWGVCWMNFEALIITVGVIGGVIVFAFTCCMVYCCCCRGRSKKKHEMEDAQYSAQKMERKAKSDERRAERKERLDEIRRKYGLMKDEPYQRFDA